MRGWLQWACLAILALGGACGSGSGGDGVCGQVLGEEVVQPLLGVHRQQVQLEVRFLTTERSFLQSLGVTFPQTVPVEQTTSLFTFAGTHCDFSTAAAASAVGGAVGGAVDTYLIPEGTSGVQGLPRIVAAPNVPTTGADVFPTMPGPGVFSIAAGVRQTPQDLDPVPGGRLLTMLPGISGTSLIYSLTDDTGFNQFLTDIQGSAATRIVSAPTVVTLAGQEALIFVGNERPQVTQLTPPHRDAAQAVSPTATRAEVGVQLRVVPTVSSGGVLRLDLSPEITAVVESPVFRLAGQTDRVARIPVSQPVGNRMTLLMSSGDTAILGGTQTSLSTTTGLPFLANLPLVSGFSRQNLQLNTETDDLLVLIRARIVRNDDL